MVKKCTGKTAKRSQSPSRRWSTNAALQAKLAQLSTLATEGNREAFARAFVPLDLTEDELMGYVTDLRTNEEQWNHVRPHSHTVPAITTYRRHSVVLAMLWLAAGVRYFHNCRRGSED